MEIDRRGPLGQNKINISNMYCTLELVDQTPIYLMDMFVNKNIVAQVIVGMMDMFNMILIRYDVEENAANLYSLTADI
jgi:hypothetical protein